MPDLKISQLTAATTPLDGTEVLPIVQAGTTDQVTVANLTAGRAVSATSLTVGAGAVGTPSLTTSGDLDTGVWFPAADTLAVSTAGAERVRVDSVGRVGIGAVSPDTTKVSVGGTLPSSSASSFSFVAEGTAPSASTSFLVNFYSLAKTEAASFTLGDCNHFLASQGSIGAGSSITNQVGFLVGASLNGAANNYGFRSNIASGTGRYNFYAAGTADNYFAGNVGIGLVSFDSKLIVGGTLPSAGNASYAIRQNGTIPSSSTILAVSYDSIFSTQVASFTIGDGVNYRAVQGTIGAGSTVTTIFGFYADASLTGGTSNVGFCGNIASGTGRWNFYASGTAQSYFAGNVQSSALVMPGQGAPTSKSAAATLTGAELVAGMLQYTGGAATVNLPTGTNIEGALQWAANNVSLDLFVVNTGSGTCTIGANGNTTVGTLTVSAGTSAQFRIRRTATNAFTVYRVG